MSVVHKLAVSDDPRAAVPACGSGEVGARCSSESTDVTCPDCVRSIWAEAGAALHPPSCPDGNCD